MKDYIIKDLRKSCKDGDYFINSKSSKPKLVTKKNIKSDYRNAFLIPARNRNIAIDLFLLFYGIPISEREHYSASSTKEVQPFHVFP